MGEKPVSLCVMGLNDRGGSPCKLRSDSLGLSNLRHGMDQRWSKWNEGKHTYVIVPFLLFLEKYSLSHMS